MMYDSFFWEMRQQDDISHARFMSDAAQKKAMNINAEVISLR